MKRITTLFVALLFISIGHAQPLIDSTKAIYDGLPQYLFPTGLLHNRSPLYPYCFSIDSNLQWQINPDYAANPYVYTGSIPAPVIKKQHFGWLYNDMLHSCTNPQLLADAATYRIRDSIARSIYEVPIAALHLEFNRLIPGAVDSGYLYYDTLLNRLTLLPDTIWFDRPNNVYHYNANPDSSAQLGFTTHQTFAGALTSDALYKKGSQFTVTFGLASSLFASNKNNQITYLEMDFDNGQNFQPIQFDIPKTIHYNGSNWENYERILRLRVHYGQECFETQMPLVIVPNVKPADTVIYASSLPLQCNIPTNGFIPDEAMASIRYGNPGKKLLKPAIICEGFESSDKPYGYNTFSSISSGYIVNSNQKRIFEQAALLKEAFDSLTALGYDIIYIDNKNHQDHIQANAINVIKVIQWANEELKRNNSREKLVVIGASMGGLVARYALSKMEADGCCHNTRVYATFDSPHQGANVPLGIQHSVRHLDNALGFIDQVLWNNTKVAPNWKALNSVGAKQMLVSHIEPDAQAIRNAFKAEYDSLGQPQQCRRVALINGSERGLGNIITAPNKRYFHSNLFLPIPYQHHLGITWQPWANVIGVPMFFPLFYMVAHAEANNTVFFGNNPDAARYLSAKILLVHGLSVAAQLILKVLSYINIICTPCVTAPITPLQIATNGILANLHTTNAISNVLLPAHYTVSNGFLNYSEAPGSLSNNPKTIVEELNSFGIKTSVLHTPYDAFIPSISALDLDTNDLFINMFSYKEDLEYLIPFDSYWAPAREDEAIDSNMLHIEVTEENYNWLIEHIDLNDELRDPQTGEYFRVLGGYYNFGKAGGLNWDKPFLKHLYNVDIVNGGNLHINKHDVIGFAGGQYSTDFGSDFKCYTGQNCDEPLVRVKNGGSFTIGDVGNTATMYFQKSSTLEIETGGILRINNRSRLIIEEDAELIIHPGAGIELIGPSAILEIKGKVTLMPNATLFASGAGFIRFAQPMQDANDVANYWEVDSTASVYLASTNGSKRAEFLIDFFAPTNLSSFGVSNAGIAIAPNKALHLYNVPVYFQGANFHGLDSTNLHNGVHLNGQTAVIDSSIFRHGVVGLNNNLSQNSKFVSLANSSFIYNTVGVRLTNGTFNMQNCTIRYNTTGFEGEALSGTSTILESILAHNTEFGLKVKTANNGALEVDKTAINDNNYGVAIENARFRGTCNNISNNYVGVRVTSSFLDLSDHAFNHLTNNMFSIQSVEAHGIFLELGYNDFTGSGTYITGSLAPKNANPNLNIAENRMLGTSNALPISLNWMGQFGWNPVPVVNWTPNVTIGTTCAPPPSKVGNSVAANIFVLLPSFKVINTNTFSNIFFNEALAEAARLVSTPEEVFDDLQAINRFNEVLTAVAGPFTDVEQIAIEKAVEMMVTALNNIYEQGLIPRNGAAVNEDEHPYLVLVTHQIEERLGNVNISAEQLFNYNLLLAQTYRMAEHYDYALEVLGDLAYTNSGLSVLESEYWECVCTAENDLLLGNTDPESFIYQLDECRILLSAMQKQQPSPQHGTSPVQEESLTNKLVKSIFPNPTVATLVIDFGETLSSVSVEITDMGGSLVQRASFQSTSRGTVDVSGLPTGTYILKLMSEQQTESLRFVKM